MQWEVGLAACTPAKPYLDLSERSEIANKATGAVVMVYSGYCGVHTHYYYIYRPSIGILYCIVLFIDQIIKHRPFVFLPLTGTAF